MDCGPEFFAMMSFQAANYNMSDFRVIWFFFLFPFVHQVQFKFKNFISSWGPPLLHGLESCQFATHCCQHACTDTPQDEAEWTGKSCTILSGKVLFLPFHTLCFPYVLQDTEIISQWWHLHWMMLQSSSILWIQCLKRFSKICSG